MSYGATDYFGFDDATAIFVQSGEFSPSNTTDATVSDENGDIACRTKAGEVEEYSNDYKLCGGATVDIDATFGKVGDVVTHNSKDLQITAISVNTTNSEEPTVSITGILETAGQTHATYTTGLSVVASKGAQTFGLAALTTGNYVTAGSFEIGGSHSVVEDSQGDIVCREPYGFRLTASHTIQNCTASPTATADTGWALENPIGESSTNTDYGSATVDVFKDLLKDVVP